MKVDKRIPKLAHEFVAIELEPFLVLKGPRLSPHVHISYPVIYYLEMHSDVHAYTYMCYVYAV